MKKQILPLLLIGLSVPTVQAMANTEAVTVTVNKCVRTDSSNCPHSVTNGQVFPVLVAGTVNPPDLSAEINDAYAYPSCDQNDTEAASLEVTIQNNQATPINFSIGVSGNGGAQPSPQTAPIQAGKSMMVSIASIVYCPIINISYTNQ